MFARYADTTLAQRHLERLTTAVLLAGTPAASNSATPRQPSASPDLGTVLAEASQRGLPGAGADTRFRRRPGRKPAHWRRSGTCAWAHDRCAGSGAATSGGNWPTCGPSPGSSRGRRPARTSRAGTASAPGWRPSATCDLLRAAYAQWPLFAALIDVAEMSLAKTHRDLAAPVPRARRAPGHHRTHPHARWI